MQESEVRPASTPAPRLAGRSWLAEYVRGAGHDLFVVSAGPRLHGACWMSAVQAVYDQTHVVLMGKTWCWVYVQACSHGLALEDFLTESFLVRHMHMGYTWEAIREG